MNIYQLKITLEHIRPAIWRSVQVTGDTRLDELHDIFQIVMGWEDCHLHQFIIGDKIYGIPSPEYPGAFKNEHNAILEKIAKQGDKFFYEYDFGDGWRHQIKVEKVIPAEKDQRYPVCLAGAGACPPEDCGGIPGYMNLLVVLNDPDNEEYEEMQEWIGEDFNPERFDLAEINKTLWRLR